MARSTAKPARAQRLPAQPSAAVLTRGGGWAERRFALILLVLCAVGLLCRVAILWEYLAEKHLAGAPANDARMYWEWAEQIAAGHLTQDAPFFSAPLYPYLLGLLRALGGTLTTVYVVQLLMDLTTVIVLASVCRARFGARVGLLAAALFLLLQEPASAALRVLASSLHLLLVTLVWAALVHVQSAPSSARRLIAGAALGLLCLAYAPALVVVVAVCIWLFWQSARRARDAFRAVVPAVVAAVVVTPATLHNWRASGELFVVQGGSGITLRQGNGPGAQGGYTPVPGISLHRGRMHQDVLRACREATGRKPTWKAVDHGYRDQVLASWRADPPGALRLAAIKLYLFLSSRNYSDLYQPSAEIASGLNRTLRLAPLLVPWLMGPALVGLGLMLRRPLRHAPEWLLFTVPLVVVVVFFYSPRYRAPAVPIVVVAAAWALERAADWRARWRTTMAVGAALAAGVLLGPVNQAVGTDLLDRSSVRFNLAHAYLEERNYPAAVEMLREGLQLRPDDAARQIVLADTLRNLGRLDEAVAEYARARVLQPDNAELFLRPGKALMDQRRFAEVQALLTPAVEQFPRHAILLSMYADALIAQGHADQARKRFAQSLSLAPEDLTLRAAYGSLLLRLERWEDARAEFTRIVQAAPDYFEAHSMLGVIGVQLRDLDSARTHFERALQIRPRSVPTLHDLGLLNFQQGRLDEAARYFRRVLALEPGHKCRALLEQAERRRATQPAAGP